MKDGVNAGPNGQGRVRTPFFGPETYLEPNPNTQQGVCPPPDFGPHMSALSRPALAALGSHQQPARISFRPARSQPAPASSSLDAYSACTETVRADLGRTALSDRRRFFVESGIYEPEVDELPAGQGLQRGLITALWLVLPFWVAVGCMILRCS